MKQRDLRSFGTHFLVFWGPQPGIQSAHSASQSPNRLGFMHPASWTDSSRPRLNEAPADGLHRMLHGGGWSVLFQIGPAITNAIFFHGSEQEVRGSYLDRTLRQQTCTSSTMADDKIRSHHQPSEQAWRWQSGVKWWEAWWVSMQGAVARRGVADVTMLDGLAIMDPVVSVEMAMADSHQLFCLGIVVLLPLSWFSCFVCSSTLRISFSYSCDWLLFYIVGVVIITFSFCFAICVFMPPACLMSLIIADIRCQSQDYKWWS